MSNLLETLSYFEFHSRDGDYVSRFPSGKTTPGKWKDVPTKAHFVFGGSMPTEKDLYEHLNVLAANFFPFADIYWFMKPGNVINGAMHYTSTEIIHWLGSLKYEFIGFESTHIKFLIKSISDTAFSVPAFKTHGSLPQEAIDSIPVCKAADGSLRTILGRRAANPPVIVTFSGGRQITIQNKAGYVLYGEHLLPEKKKQIDATYVSFLAGDKSYLEITEQEASEALRAVYEEGGLTLDGKVSAYMIGKDSEPGRDPRYWVYNNKFGYERISSSFNVLLIVPMIDTLPEPVDTIECQKGVILTEKMAREEFRVGGKYDPVFPCHVRQLKSALDIAGKI